MTGAISEGSRVICHKPGPHDGKRGRVLETMWDCALVEFQSSSIIEPMNVFEPVNA